MCHELSVSLSKAKKYNLKQNFVDSRNVLVKFPAQGSWSMQSFARWLIVAHCRVFLTTYKLSLNVFSEKTISGRDTCSTEVIFVFCFFIIACSFKIKLLTVSPTLPVISIILLLIYNCTWKRNRLYFIVLFQYVH